MNRIELQRARAARRASKQVISENDPNVAAIVEEMRSNGSGGIFGTLGTDSMMQEKKNNFMGQSRRQFPEQSAMKPIDRDYRPGSQADGGTKQRCKRQFPTKNAVKSIDRTPVQHFIEQQEQHQRKRMMEADPTNHRGPF